MSLTTALELAATVWLILLVAFGVRIVTRCHHAWKVVTDREFPPPMEVFSKSGFHPTDPNLHLKGCKRTYFAVIACDKCGAVKTFKERA